MLPLSMISQLGRATRRGLGVLPRPFSLGTFERSVRSQWATFSLSRGAVAPPKAKAKSEAAVQCMGDTGPDWTALGNQPAVNIRPRGYNLSVSGFDPSDKNDDDSLLTFQLFDEVAWHINIILDRYTDRKVILCEWMQQLDANHDYIIRALSFIAPISMIKLIVTVRLLANKKVTISTQGQPVTFTLHKD